VWRQVGSSLQFSAQVFSSFSIFGVTHLVHEPRESLKLNARMTELKDKTKELKNRIDELERQRDAKREKRSDRKVQRSQKQHQLYRCFICGHEFPEEYMIFDAGDTCYDKNACGNRLKGKYEHYIKGKTATLDWWENTLKKLDKWSEDGTFYLDTEAENIIAKMKKAERKKKERRKQQMRDRSPTRFQE
jgi:DNA repair exonuclease SbcCD ATPase subunit